MAICQRGGCFSKGVDLAEFPQSINSIFLNFFKRLEYSRYSLRIFFKLLKILFKRIWKVILLIIFLYSKVLNFIRGILIF